MVMIFGIPDEERLLKIKARAMACASVWRGAGVAEGPGPAQACESLGWSDGQPFTVLDRPSVGRYEPVASGR